MEINQSFQESDLGPVPTASHPLSTDGGRAPAGNASTLWICSDSVAQGNIFYTWWFYIKVTVTIQRMHLRLSPPPIQLDAYYSEHI